jgi:hypothetical protein
MGNKNSTNKENEIYQTEQNKKLSESLKNAVILSGQIAKLKKELKGKKDEVKQKKLDELEKQLKEANKIKYLKYKIKYLQLQNK